MDSHDERQTLWRSQAFQSVPPKGGHARCAYGEDPAGTCRDAGTGEGRARPHPPPRNQAPAHAPVRTQQTLWKGPSTWWRNPGDLVKPAPPRATPTPASWQCGSSTGRKQRYTETRGNRTQHPLDLTKRIHEARTAITPARRAARTPASLTDREPLTETVDKSQWQLGLA